MTEPPTRVDLPVARWMRDLVRLRLVGNRGPRMIVLDAPPPSQDRFLRDREANEIAEGRFRAPAPLCDIDVNGDDVKSP